MFKSGYAGTGAIFHGKLDTELPADRSAIHSGYCAIRSTPIKVRVHLQPSQLVKPPILYFRPRGLSLYFRPHGLSLYFRPHGLSLYFRPHGLSLNFRPRGLSLYLGHMVYLCT